MSSTDGARKKLALVYGNLPTVEEIDQFRLLAGDYDISVVSSESIVGYLTQTSYFHDLRCVSVPDHDENATYLPGLEKVLSEFDLVIVKERLGMYAFQAVKAKWKSRFRLAYWVDNATPFPGEDIDQMRIIREEVNAAADAFIVQTDTTEAALKLEGIEPERITRFNPWVETRVKRNGKVRAKALETLGLADSDFVICHFGQIEWEEGLHDLAHGLALVKELEPSLADRVKVVFCGIGSFSNELRDRLVELGIDRSVVYVAPSRDAFDTVVAGADAMYMANNPARDRVEADPYRVLTAMANKIPLIAPRMPITEELCGKHRLDFCANAPQSIALAIRKGAQATALRGNIVNKNVATVKERYCKSKVTKEMADAMARVFKAVPAVDTSALDHQVNEVEALVRNKQYIAAIDVIETIFKLQEIPVHHHANLLRLIGDCFTKLGDGESGRDSYTRAIELDPYQAKAHIGLGTVCLTTNAFERAVPHFQKAISLAPTDEMANLGLGLAFQGIEEYAEANRWVVKSLECNPENTAALFTIVQIAGASNEYSAAEKALVKYTSAHPHDHNMVYTLAGIQHKMGKNSQAMTLLQGILSVNPNDERAAGLKNEIDRLQASAGQGGA